MSHDPSHPLTSHYFWLPLHCPAVTVDNHLSIDNHIMSWDNIFAVNHGYCKWLVHGKRFKNTPLRWNLVWINQYPCCSRSLEKENMVNLPHVVWKCCFQTRALRNLLWVGFRVSFNLKNLLYYFSYCYFYWMYLQTTLKLLTWSEMLF